MSIFLENFGLSTLSTSIFANLGSSSYALHINLKLLVDYLQDRMDLEIELLENSFLVPGDLDFFLSYRIVETGLFILLFSLLEEWRLAIEQTWFKVFLVEAYSSISFFMRF